MKTIFTPAYGNIFTDHFERKYSHISIFRSTCTKSYTRFIDDIFFAWIGSEDQLIKFLNVLNTKHISVKLEYKISQSSIPFPETKFISKTKNCTQRLIGKKQTIQSRIYH